MVGSLLYIFPLFFGVSGALLLGIGVLRTVQRRRFLSEKRTAKGVVDRLIEERKGRAVRYFVQYRYEPAGGPEVVFRSNFPIDKPLFEEGEEVEILYSPRKPHKAVVRDFWQLWFWPIFLSTMGVLFLGVALYLYLNLSYSLESQ